MEDKEIRETAKRIILNAWNNGANQNNPERISIRESSTGVIECCIKIDEGDLGRGEVFYSPHPFIENLIRQAEKEMDILTRKSSPLIQEVAFTYWEKKLGETASILVRNIQGEFEWVLAQQGVLALSIFYEGANQIPVNEQNLIPIKRALEDFSKQRKKRIDFFINETKESHIAPQVLFCHFYEDQKQLWKEVKKCYKDSQKYPNPLEMVKSAYPQLPTHLIERLSDPDPYVSQPATLALQATAIITNVPKSISSVRALHQYLDESIKLREEMPKAEFRKALLHFVGYVRNVWAQQDRIAELIEQEKETSSNSTTD